MFKSNWTIWWSFIFYLVCLTFSISYSVFPFHLFHVFQFLSFFVVILSQALITFLCIVISREINKAEFKNLLPIFLFKGQLFYFPFWFINSEYESCWVYALQLFFSLWKVCSHLNCILLHQLYKIRYLKVLTRPSSVYLSKPLTKAKVREFLHGTYSQVTQDFLHIINIPGASIIT